MDFKVFLSDEALSDLEREGSRTFREKGKP
jgi:hypothetical protein